jgi:lysophospholipase L1-like esterase
VLRLLLVGRLCCIAADVARSSRANQGGWARLLAARLCDLYGLNAVNEAIGSTTTSTWAPLLPRLLRRHRPRAVVIGLSTGNEGLATTPNLETATALTRRFHDDLSTLGAMASTFPTVRLVVIGGPYPSNANTAHAAKALRQLNHRLLQDLPWPVVDFLNSTADGHGHWRRGEFADAAHPNNAGHRRMFAAVDVSMFAGLTS